MLQTLHIGRVGDRLHTFSKSTLRIDGWVRVHWLRRIASGFFCSPRTCCFWCVRHFAGYAEAGALVLFWWLLCTSWIHTTVLSPHPRAGGVVTGGDGWKWVVTCRSLDGTSDESHPTGWRPWLFRFPIPFQKPNERWEWAWPTNHPPIHHVPTAPSLMKDRDTWPERVPERVDEPLIHPLRIRYESKKPFHTWWKNFETDHRVSNRKVPRTTSRATQPMTWKGIRYMHVTNAQLKPRSKDRESHDRKATRDARLWRR